MSDKVLGQKNPSAATADTLYTCSTSAFVASAIWACNTSSTPAVIRIGICKTGLAGITHLILSDYPLDGNYFGCVATGVGGKTGDNITIRASTANVAFTMYGFEV